MRKQEASMSIGAFSMQWNKEGVVLAEYKMRRIMRENGLYPVKKVKIKPARKGK